MGSALEKPRWVGPLGIGLCIASLILASLLAFSGQWVRAIVSAVISVVLGSWGVHEYRQARRTE